MSQSGGLKRSLGLWAIVGLGLGYMTPTVLFDTFGIVTKETHGVVPLAYLVALVVMISIGVTYAVVLTKVTGKRLADLGMDEGTAAEPEHALVAEPRTAERVPEEALPAEPRTAERVLAGV